MITYSQTTGRIVRDGDFLGTGYSGHGDGLDNPEMESVPNEGPIPRGDWEIVEWFESYEDKGPCVAQLSPVGHDAHGRTGFLIHGDNAAMDHTASDGCIVASRDIREALRASGDTELQVTA